MDPASLIGVCGVAVQLVELLGKSIKTLSDLQGRWKDVDLALLSLKTQLNTLRAALLAICQWVDRHGADENYLLRMELDGSLRCCRLLINKIDLFLNDVRASVRMGSRSSTLELRKKIKVVFGGSSLDNVLNMIDRQTASMNLLLTACHCHDTLQQKAFLEEPATQEAFQKSKQDTASLHVHSDNDSTKLGTPSVLSTVSSKLSVVFEFDHELFATKVYGIVHRAAVVTSLRRNHRAPPKHSGETRGRSAQASGGRSLRKETFVVDGHAREDVLLKSLQTPTIALAEQVTLWRRIVIRRVLAYDTIKLIEQWPLDELYPHDRAVCTMAWRHLQGVVEGHTDLDSPEASEIVSRLWGLQYVQPLLDLNLTKDRWFALASLESQAFELTLPFRSLLYNLVQASTSKYEPSPIDWEQYTTGPTFRSLQWTSRRPLTIHLTQVNDDIEPKSQLVDRTRRCVSSLHMIDILRLKFTGPLIELLVLLPDLVESGWLQSQSKVIRLGDVESLEEKIQTRSRENNTTMAAKYVQLGFEQIGDKTRPAQTEIDETGEEGDLVHFLIRYPEETILVEYSSLEQDFLRVGVLASKPCLWELYAMAVDGI